MGQHALPTVLCSLHPATLSLDLASHMSEMNDPKMDDIAVKFLCLNSELNAVPEPCSLQCEGVIPSLFDYFEYGRSTFAPFRCSGPVTSGSHISNLPSFPLISSAGEVPLHYI